VANLGETYQRCLTPSCKKRVVNGQRYCHLHGGPQYVAQKPDYLPCEDMLQFSLRMALEDLVVHIHGCPQCQNLIFDNPPWLWLPEERLQAHTMACGYGQTILDRVSECIHDGGTISIAAQNNTDKINHIIELIIQHFSRCKHCKEHRGIQAVWEWPDSEKTRFHATCCVPMAHLIGRWDGHGLRNKIPTRATA